LIFTTFATQTSNVYTANDPDESVEDYLDAVNAYVKHNDTKAFKIFKKMAEEGDVRGEYNVGVMYLDATGVAQNDSEALKWLLRAAQHQKTEDSVLTIAQAQYFLGSMYAEGRGVPKNYPEAAKWFCNSAVALSVSKSKCTEMRSYAEKTARQSPTGLERKQVRAVSDEEVYERSEKCAKSAAQWINKPGDTKEGVSGDAMGTTVMNYTNHYNSKLNQCLALVTTRYVPKDKGATVRTKALYNIHENKEIAGITKINDGVVECKFNDEWCRSEDEWEALVKPYMEE
jgi:hypothetical protein